MFTPLLQQIQRGLVFEVKNTCVLCIYMNGCVHVCVCVCVMREGLWKFPGGQVVRTWSCHCYGLGSIPDQGTEILQAMKYGQRERLLGPLWGFA